MDTDAASPRRVGTMTPAAASTSTSKPLGKDLSLRPIPMLSPSQFTPHLPPVLSITQGKEEAEVAELVSSIEQFSSPEKSKKGSERGWEKRKKLKGRARGKGKEGERTGAIESDHRARGDTANDASITEQEDDSLEAVVMERGLQLAEQARVQRMKTRGGEARQGMARKTVLTDLSKASGKDHKGKGRERDIRDVERIFGRRRRGQTPRTGTCEGQERETHEAPGTNKIPIAALREEEEESTQDLMMEQVTKNGVDVEMGSDALQPPAQSGQNGEGVSATAAKPEKIVEVEDVSWLAASYFLRTFY